MDLRIPKKYFIVTKNILSVVWSLNVLIVSIVLTSRIRIRNKLLQGYNYIIVKQNTGMTTNPWRMVQTRLKKLLLIGHPTKSHKYIIFIYSIFYIQMEKGKPKQTVKRRLYKNSQTAMMYYNWIIFTLNVHTDWIKNAEGMEDHDLSL